MEKGINSKTSLGINRRAHTRVSVTDAKERGGIVNRGQERTDWEIITECRFARYARAINDRACTVRAHSVFPPKNVLYDFAKYVLCFVLLYSRGINQHRDIYEHLIAARGKYYFSFSRGA